MTFPPRDSILWTIVLTLACSVYVWAHCLPAQPHTATVLEHVATFAGVVSAKLGWSPLAASENAGCPRSFVRRLLDAIAASIP